MAIIHHINEYNELFGGWSNLRLVGNKFKALINQTFGESLIFSIIEMVNLNHPSLDGEGITFLYTHLDDKADNKLIIEKYEKVISEIKSLKMPVSAFKNWYKLNSLIYFHQSESPIILSSENSTWRLDGHLQNKSQKKKDFGYLNDDLHTVEFVTNYANEYFSLYLEHLNEKIPFDQFPFFTVIIRPVSVKTENDIFELGNIYLHFATTVKKDKHFYSRLLNDFLYVWLKEMGGTIIDKIKDKANKEAAEIIFDTLKEGYPSIWTNNCKIDFSSTEKEKIDLNFGKSDTPLSYFFDEAFKNPEYHSELKRYESIILEDFLPVILKSKNWLKAGVQTKGAEAVIKSLKPRADHSIIKAFDEKNLTLFLRILVGRNIINVCTVLFGLLLDEVHTLFTAKYFDNRHKKLDESSTIGTIGPYLSQYFIYCPINKNMLQITKDDMYNSASFKEKQFLRNCVERISLLIDTKNIHDFNSTTNQKLILNERELKFMASNKISLYDVSDFKNNWCDENTIISKLLLNKCQNYLVEPILDCGAGLGDIAYNAFRDKQAYLIDVNKFDPTQNPISPKHNTYQICFYDYYPEEPIKTLLISHTLQFIDDDIIRLNKKISEINPQFIILVINKNDGLMGELLEWTYDHYEYSNPEVHIDDFPNGYNCIDTIPFKATVCCDNFENLAKQISYLMMFELSDTGQQLQKFLQTKLSEASFTINQIIKVYSK